MKSISY